MLVTESVPQRRRLTELGIPQKRAKGRAGGLTPPRQERVLSGWLSTLNLETSHDAHHASALPAASASFPINPAQNLFAAAQLLFPRFEAGKAIDAKVLRTAMEEAFGASDTEGAWVWKDAYEAAEAAQIMMLSRYGTLMQRQAASPQAFLAMIERLAALAPPHTRRSEDSIRLQQFSTAPCRWRRLSRKPLAFAVMTMFWNPPLALACWQCSRCLQAQISP